MGPKPQPLSSCPTKIAEGLEQVPLIRLIANPRVYDGRRVRLIGFMHLEFEGDALYLDREAFEAANDYSSVRIAWSMGDAQRVAKRLNDRYVLIEATFNAGDEDDGFALRLQDLTRLEYWPSRRESEREARTGRSAPSTSFGCPDR